jgi:hypothetical protein
MVSPEDVFDFVERLYASEVEDARFYFDCARKYAGREHLLHNAKVHWKKAKNLRARINLMRGNG